MGQDLLRFDRNKPWRWIATWGVPFILFLLGGVFDLRPWLYGAGSLWLAVGCGRNAFTCGRIHCYGTLVVFSVLGILALLRGLGIHSLAWSVWWILLAVGTFLAFLPEWLGYRYLGKRAVS